MNEFQELYDKAHAAGHAAATAKIPRPMIVGEAKSLFSNEIDFSKKTYYESEGLCGFAWVNVKPGTSKFARWLKKTGKARTDEYYGGVCIWVSGYGQSFERKEAYARAFANVLAATGINAYAQSRLD